MSISGPFEPGKSRPISSDRGIPSPQKPESKTPREQLIGIFTQNALYSLKIDKLFDFLDTHCLEELYTLEDFLTAHNDKCQELKKAGGWIAYKSQIGGKGMTSLSHGLSMEQFRQKAVDLICKVALGTVKAMGYESPGSHSASGTVGWNSDIDSVYSPPLGMSETDQALEKLVADGIAFFYFNAPSGMALDTQFYLPHPETAYKTSSQMETREGRSAFAMMELRAVALQFQQQKGWIDEDSWEALREDLVMRVHDTNLRAAISAALIQIEQTEKQIKDHIDRQLLNDLGGVVHPDAEPKEIDALIQEHLECIPKGEKETAKTESMQGFLTRYFLKLAEEMDTCLSGIQNTDHHIEQLRIEDVKDRQQSIQKRELLYIRLGSLAILRNRFFDEGYITQGAFAKVCSRAGGQMYQRSVETLHTGVRQVRRKQSLIASTIRPEQTIETTPQENLISALENLAMYKGHFQKSLLKKIQSQHVVIEQSKYSERIAGALLETLQILEKTNSANLEKDPEFQSLKRDVQELHGCTQDLEKLKRGTELNYTLARDMLIKELSKKPGSNKEEIIQKVEMTLRRDPAISSPTEESILPEDRYLIIFIALVDLGFITPINKSDEAGNPLASDPQITAILKARCGLVSMEKDKAMKREIESCLKQAKPYVLKQYNLTSDAAVERFNKILDSLVFEVYEQAIEYEGIDPSEEAYNNAISTHGIVKELMLELAIAG